MMAGERTNDRLPVYGCPQGGVNFNAVAVSENFLFWLLQKIDLFRDI